MDKITVFPEKKIPDTGKISRQFLSLGIDRFTDACKYVHELPYGYNSDRDDIMILFKEMRGTCITKHAVIATLAEELDLPISKVIAVYAMTEEIVTGAELILDKYTLPYVPMVHCYLTFDNFKVDLTEGNQNGKNRTIEDFLFEKKVIPNISAKEEYLLYRQTLENLLLTRDELQGVELKRILQAHEEGLALLKLKVS